MGCEDVNRIEVAQDLSQRRALLLSKPFYQFRDPDHLEWIITATGSRKPIRFASPKKKEGTSCLGWGYLSLNIGSLVK
jgi:hypothetical protein